MIKLQFEISSIRDQIASADMDRQARGGHMNARWYHRARTALRIKKEELAHLMDHIKGLPDASRQRKASLKDAIIETVREDYDDDEWQSVMDDAHHLLNSKGGA
ncbi:MAG: hypothetical protein HQL77_14100 [Magnetococcales bacterium]|nr:hypothetical protein [Magnetococcales bacterium]MBF0421077.1 hypothetical protein [Magnetococcales bacterium]MBF0436492.1 hypothetical protein [Magnetococcales bacterium]